MFRRNFLQGITAAGTTGVAGKAARPARIVRYRVKGFSCVTCAAGLEVMLQKKDGIATAKATYPEGDLTVGFDPSVISEAAIEGFIRDTGFTIER